MKESIGKIKRGLYGETWTLDAAIKTTNSVIDDVCHVAVAGDHELHPREKARNVKMSYNPSYSSIPHHWVSRAIFHTAQTAADHEHALAKFSFMSATILPHIA